MNTHYVLVAPKEIDYKYLIFGEYMKRKTINKADIDIKITDDINKVHIYNDYNSAKEEAMQLLITIEDNPVVGSGGIGIQAIDSSYGVVLTNLNNTVENFLGLFEQHADKLVLPYEKYKELMPYRGLSMEDMNRILGSSSINAYKGYFRYEQDLDGVLFCDTSQGEYVIEYLDEAGNKASDKSVGKSDHDWKLSALRSQGVKIISEGKV